MKGRVADMHLSLKQARRLALHCQGLDGDWDLPPGKAGVAEIFERLGYVQIDTIHVIERAHHHVLWSRRPDYTPQMLHELLAEDRAVFEWWTHAASYIPTTDFRFYAPRMGERALSPRQKTWIEEHQAVMDHVLARIRAEGALGTSDFKAPEGFNGGSWWSGWKPAKRALEVFFNKGVLLVSERRKFQRIYDLRERVIPEDADHPVPDEDELHDFLLRRVVSTLGIVPEGRLYWWRRARPGEAALDRALEAGLVTRVAVEGYEDEPWYALTDALLVLDHDPVQALHILSPFDNLIIRRPWMEQVFGWDYRLECYLPKAKRQYGYFALPILWGTRFIGRVDAKADRKPRTLLVRQLTFEPDFDAYDEVMPLLADRLRAFAAFNDCDTVDVERVMPNRYKPALEKQLLLI